MRMPHPTPTHEPLPFERGAPRMRARDDAAPAPPLQWSGAAVAAFDALLHELHPDAARVDDARLRRLALWLLDLAPDEAHAVLDARLDRLDLLRAMRDDPDWDSDDATRARLAKLVEYVERDDDLIPDGEPLLGRLDDVLLIELAWPAFAEESEDYRDFCDYRAHEHPDGDAARKRAVWLRDRLDELALLQHRMRVHDSHYVSAPFGADRPFRVAG